MASTRRIAPAHLGLFVLVGITMATSPSWVDAAEIFSCGEGGKPDVKTAKCICPAPKIEQTVGKKSTCVAAPPKVVVPVVPKVAVAPEPPGVALGPRKAGSGAMVKIPGGTFQMGDNLELATQPIHSVTVASFEIDETEVTVDAYKLCVGDKGCSTTEVTGEVTDMSGHDYCNWAEPGRGKNPMNCIDWAQSEAFCKWAGKRLPTEEEWEYAARKGAEGRTYPWGNAGPNEVTPGRGIGSPLRLCSDDNPKAPFSTCPVGLYGSTDDPWGLKDMAGNVSEWTASGWSGDYSKKRANNSRIRRGGASDEQTESNFRGAHRFWDASTYRSYEVGVRCAG